MAAEWTLALCDERGNELVELRDAWARRYSAARNRAAEYRLRVDVEDDAARAVTTVLPNGLPRLKAWRGGVLRFYGWWAPSRISATPEEGSYALEFRDPFARYWERLMEAQTFTATDAGLIASTLVSDREATDAGVGVVRYGLEIGTVEPTVNRDRTYERGKVYGEAIQQLTEVDGGFDFTVTPRDDLGADVLGVLDIHASQGDDRTGLVFFEHGPGTLDNVASVEVQLGYPLNYVEARGEEGAYGGAGDVESAERFGYFTKSLAASDGTVVQATLDGMAAAAVRPEPVSVVSFSPDVDSAPQPWADYWIGDTVTFCADRGALQVDAAPRVNGVEIALEDGTVAEASHTLAIEEEAPG